MSKEEKGNAIKKNKRSQKPKGKGFAEILISAMPEQNCPKAGFQWKEGMLTVTCCKCLFYQVAANLASILAKNTQNVPKIRSGQKAPGIKEKDKS